MDKLNQLANEMHQWCSKKVYSFIYARRILHECPERPTESF